MTDTENKVLYIAEQLRKAGFMLAGAAGVIANIEAESAFNSKNVEDQFEKRVGGDEAYTAAVDNGSYGNFAGDAVGYGLAQWTAADRKDSMLRFHRYRGVSIGDFCTQVDWLIEEMRHYVRAYSTCTNSNDPYQCGYDVCKYYEICDNLEAQSQYRGGQARRWYDWLSSHIGEEITFSEATEGPEEPDVGGGATDIPPVVFWPPRGYRGGQGDPGLCMGMSGADVELLCTILKARGYNIDSIDSHFSNVVDEVVRQYQKANNLSVDGIVGYNTWRSLLAMP